MKERGGAWGKASRLLGRKAARVPGQGSSEAVIIAKTGRIAG